ncbi:MAG: Fic family protein [Nanoarchaeota archaeon]
MQQDFSERLGRLVQASKAAYFTYEPKFLPVELKYDEELIKLLADAVQSISNLSTRGARLRNPHILIMPYLKKEAVLSSKIEGTRTSLSEVFLEEKEKIKSPNADLEEVNNYVQSLHNGLKEIQKQNFTTEMIKLLHGTLMKGVRGQDKEPGKFKTKQNWIGSSDEILEAKFVPASPETTPALIDNLIDYINNSERSTNLIKAGIMHYQFETVHPFRDGNGRIGRLLISLFLCKTKTLSQPLLYLSAYFDKHKPTYDEKLFNASSKGDIEGWLKFFLKAIKVQSDEVLLRTEELENYREECREKLEINSNSTNVLRVLDFLYINPFIKIGEVKKQLKCHYPTAENNVAILVKNGILKEYTIRKKRDRIFYCPRICDILGIQIKH